MSRMPAFIARAGLVLLASLAACSDSSAPESPSAAVFGSVVSLDSGPVANAAIVLDLDFVEQGPAAEKPLTEIVFDLPEAVPYTLRITDVCDAEVFHTVRDSAAAPGLLGILWDGRDDDGRLLVEGLFHAHFQADGHEPVVHDLAVARNLGAEAGDFLLVDGATVRETWRIAAWTDADGRFRVARDCWEFGGSTVLRDEQGDILGALTVAPRVRVWAYPEGRLRGVASGWVEFDPAAGAEASIMIRPDRSAGR